MKKIFTLIVLLVAFSSATSAKVELDLATEWGTSGYKTTYDTETYTITYEDSSWGSRGIWLGSYPGTDYSQYGSIVVVFKSDLNATFQLVAESYEDESTTSNVTANIKGSGDGEAEQMITLDLGDAATSLRQIYLQSSVAGTVTMVSATLYEPGESIEILDLVLPLSRFTSGVANDDGSYSFTGSDTYGWFNIWFGSAVNNDGTPADWSDYTYLIAEVADGSNPVQLTVEYDTSPVVRQQASGSGGSTICMTLDEENKSAVMQLAIQFQSNSGSHTAIINKIYLTNELGDKTINLSNWNLWYTKVGANVEVEVTDGVAEFWCDYDWGFFYNWLGGLDCSEYNYYVVEFSEAPEFPVMLGIEYTNDEDGTWESFEVGTTVACTALSAEYKNSIDQVVLQNGYNGEVGGTFYVSDAYFSVERVSGDQLYVVLSDWELYNNETSQNEAVPVEDGVATFTCTYDWGWFYNFFNDNGVNRSDFNYYVVEFAEPTPYAVWVGIEYVNDSEGTWQEFPAGTTTACIALSDDYKDAVKQVVIRNGDGSANISFLVSSSYFSVDEVATVGTGISNIVASPAATSDATYNLAGQRVDSSYKGIVIKNGKKVIVK